MQPEHDFAIHNVHGQDVPAVFGDEVDDDEVDLSGQVGNQLAAEMASDAGAVDLGSFFIAGGFDLDLE